MDSYAGVNAVEKASPLVLPFKTAGIAHSFNKALGVSRPIHQTPWEDISLFGPQGDGN